MTTGRSVTYRATDASALRAIAQAAINVELFTIPLYMVAAYSIQSMHPVTGKGNDFGAGRLWPGATTVADPRIPNEQAFNLIFSVFIEEMLHLQLAANIASAIGVSPVFTSPVLQNSSHGWTCYGSATETVTVIPHVIDLTDTVHGGGGSSNITINLTALTAQQVELFQIIEESATVAHSHINERSRDKYFPVVPFPGWTQDNTEVDLPMFGTIDHMYQCYYDYSCIKYADGATLWESMFVPHSQQKDMFNQEDSGHPKREYPGFSTTITATSALKALKQAVAMMNAITDQGEGSLLNSRFDNPATALEVKSAYESASDALESDYPHYTDEGVLAPSADAVARVENDKSDHYNRFVKLGELVGAVELWPDWHQRHGPWVAEDFQSKDTTGTDTNTDNPYGLPSTQSIADAYNRMAAPSNFTTSYTLVSRAAVGSVASMVSVLNQYWAQTDVTFPYPAMIGAGDRIATCWALFGQAPDLSLGVPDQISDVRYHGCQGLDLDSPGGSCALLETYHSCRGSNNCAGQGGCGFVQPIDGASCGFALVKAKVHPSQKDALFSAPADNTCRSQGGCGVPISAAQLLTRGGEMVLCDFNEDNEPEQVGTLVFNEGERVYDIAYRAYRAVMAHRDPSISLPTTPPEPTDIRLAFPPSR